MKTPSGVLIVGDTCPIGRNLSPFQQGDAQALCASLLPEFEHAQLFIANLECPLIRDQSPIEKVGPILAAPADCVAGLKAMGINAVGLANNHIMDHGVKGLRTTIEALERSGIAHVGAGENIDEARKVLVREVNGLRVGILAMAEHEFGIASRNAPGANPLDVIGYTRNINEHRYQYDRLIVLVHGGNEHYPYPRPGLVDTCRFLVEQGANAVICQHSHCVGCMEIYQDAPIVYGQGNFLFDIPSEHATWHEGCLVHLAIDRMGHFDARMIPFRQGDGVSGARRMVGQDEADWLSGFEERSGHLSSPEIIEERWRAFCRGRKRHYLHALHGKRSLLRRLVGRLDLLHILDSPDRQRLRLSLLQCESHGEALRTILEAEANRQSGKACTVGKEV